MLDKPHHDPSTCLGCVLRGYICRKYGTNGLDTLEKYKDFIDDLAAVTAIVLTTCGHDAVPNYLTWLADDLNKLAREASRPTEH